VISYLRSGYNRVMGCIMEQWGSQLTIQEFETKEQAAEFIAQEEADQAKNREYGEPLHKTYMVVEGKNLTCDFMSAKQSLDILLEGSVI